MNERRIPFPREHGAWAVLFACLLLAWAHPWARGWPAAVLAVLFCLAFAIQEPLRALARGRAGGWGAWVLLYGALLVVGATYLVLAHRMYVLLPAAGVGLVLTGADLQARRSRLHRSAVLRVAGIAALTLVLPGTLCLVHPQRADYAFVLWWLMIVQFLSRYAVVRARIAVRRGEGASHRAVLATQALLYLSAGALVLAGAAPPWILVAILPGTLLARVPRKETSLRRAGWAEVALLLWFVAAVLGAYHL